MDELLSELTKRPPDEFHKAKGGEENVIEFCFIFIDRRETSDRYDFIVPNLNMFKTISGKLKIDLRRGSTL